MGIVDAIDHRGDSDLHVPSSRFAQKCVVNLPWSEHDDKINHDAKTNSRSERQRSTRRPSIAID